MNSSDISIDISVIVAAWRADATLARAVESALFQKGVRVEVIVVNDASPDGTGRLADDLAARHRGVQALHLAVNSGPSVARNTALRAASGRYVTPLDSDDFMQPGRLSALLATAERGWDLVGDDLFMSHESAPTQIRRRLWSEQDFGTTPLDLAAFVRGNLSSQHGGRGELGFLKPLISRDFLNRNGLNYRTDMRLGEDYDLYAQALKAGARFCLTDPAGYVAVHRDTSLSGRHSAGDLAALVAADQRLLARTDLTADERSALKTHLTETQKRAHWMALIDAVKARDPAAALRCFAAPPKVALSLLGNLGEQAILRGMKRLR